MIAICAYACASRGDAARDTVHAPDPPPVVERDGGTATAPPDDRDAGTAMGDAPNQPTTPSYYFKIVAVTETQGGAEVLVAAGERTGVSPRWRGTIVDAAYHPVKGGELVILRVQPTTTTARSTLPVRTIADKYNRVRLEPP